MSDEIVEHQLAVAAEVLREYPLPNSMVDMGNLYFAATTFQRALQSRDAREANLQSQRDEAQRKYARLAFELESAHDRIVSGSSCDFAVNVMREARERVQTMKGKS